MGLPSAASSWPNLTVFRQDCLAHALIADAHAPRDLQQCHPARGERRRTGALLDIQSSTCTSTRSSADAFGTAQ